MSQDPAAFDTPERFLTDPQQLNMYSYARNNPVVYDDEGGEIIGYFLTKYLARKAGEYIKQNPREAASLAAGFVPYIGDAYDAVCAIEGKDYITGEKLSKLDRGLSGAGLLPIPFVTGGMLRATKEIIPQGIKKADNIIKLFHGTSEWRLKKIYKEGFNIDELPGGNLFFTSREEWAEFFAKAKSIDDKVTSGGILELQIDQRILDHLKNNDYLNIEKIGNEIYYNFKEGGIKELNKLIKK